MNEVGVLWWSCRSFLTCAALLTVLSDGLRAQGQGFDEPEIQLRKLQPADGMKVELFTAEPMLRNPVALCIDERGRWFVAETHRHHTGVTESKIKLRRPTLSVVSQNVTEFLSHRDLRDLVEFLASLRTGPKPKE